MLNTYISVYQYFRGEKEESARRANLAWNKDLEPVWIMFSTWHFAGKHD